MVRSAHSLIATLLLLGSAPAGAELLRIEFGVAALAFPRSLDEVESRLRAVDDVTVTWVDAVWYDAWYTAYGGAEVGTVQFAAGLNTANSATWLHFDSLDIAQSWLSDTQGWGSAYYASECDGEFCVQVYMASGDADEGRAILAALLGR